MASRARVAAVSTSHDLVGQQPPYENGKYQQPNAAHRGACGIAMAAALPRAVPCTPFFSFFSFSCLSINVALAGKMAGNARKSPPTTGPYSLAMTPAMAVIRPPKNRTAYSCHPVCCRADLLTLICIAISARGSKARTLCPTKVEVRQQRQQEPSGCGALANLKDRHMQRRLPPLPSWSEPRSQQRQRRTSRPLDLEWPMLLMGLRRTTRRSSWA